MYECEILADSIGPSGKRLTTLVVTYPRFVHAELLTHRMFSRNSASSRAIPNEKVRQRVTDAPAMPVWWGKNQAGMQAREELSDEPNSSDLTTRVDEHGEYISAKQHAKEIWLRARDKMLDASEMLTSIGLHKQLANRLIEPWMGITVIVSATEWENFLRLRCHPDAQPEIRVAAEAMRDAMAKSTPQVLEVGMWHWPLIRDEDHTFADQIGTFTDVTRLSVARCARVSYLTHDGRRDPEADLQLYARLAEKGHWSPFEHAARALAKPERIGNFIGWHQHRADVDPHFIA